MATLRGTRNADTLRGHAAADQIFGLAGADTLYGGAGADEIRGGAGADEIRGGAGADQLFGGSGNDHIFGDGGNDLIRGGAGADQIWGGAGADDLGGGGGADQIWGGAGADLIRGDGGADHLFGGAGNDRLFGGTGLDVLTGGPGADRFFFSSADEGRDRITDFNPAEGDSLRLTGALAGASVRMVDDGTNTTVEVRTTAANSFTEFAVLEGHREPIDVWYGDHQQFGDPGEAQRWVNILGTVAPAGLDSLAYTLNGGPEHTLQVGADDRRLVGPGDFNVELDYNQLDPSAADDVVRLIARYDNGDAFTRDVTIDYEGGHHWPTAYSIDWAHVTNLQDAVQVVDGLWSFDASGVRPAVQGYDRVLAIGDSSWDSYEVQLSITMHDLHTVDPRGRDGGDILLGLQWNGHTSSPVGGDVSPHQGWIPSGAFVFNSAAAILHPTEWFPQFNDNQNPIVNQPLQLLEGHTYNFLIDSQRLAADADPSDGIDRVYSLKVWEQGTPQPANFLIHQIMVDQAPHGGIYLNAHYFDVTFGDLTVDPLPPSDEVLPSQNNLTALLDTGLGPAASAPATVASSPASAAPAPATPSHSLTDLVASGDEAAAVV